MQSVNYQETIHHPANDESSVEPARPEIRPARLGRVDPTVTPEMVEQHLRDLSIRGRLAAAFRDLGRALSAGAAYERTKDFYRSSGHEWAKRLGRERG